MAGPVRGRPKRRQAAVGAEMRVMLMTYISRLSCRRRRCASPAQLHPPSPLPPQLARSDPVIADRWGGLPFLRNFHNHDHLRLYTCIPTRDFSLDQKLSIRQDQICFWSSINCSGSRRRHGHLRSHVRCRDWSSCQANWQVNTAVGGRATLDHDVHPPVAQCTSPVDTSHCSALLMSALNHLCRAI